MDSFETQRGISNAESNIWDARSKHYHDNKASTKLKAALGSYLKSYKPGFEKFSKKHIADSAKFNSEAKKNLTGFGDYASGKLAKDAPEKIQKGWDFLKSKISK